jgi:hypothetical protein
MLLLVDTAEGDGRNVGETGYCHVKGTGGGHASTHSTDTRELNILDLSELNVVERLVNEHKR